MREQIRLLVGNLDCLNVTTYALSQHNLIISTRTFTALDNHKKAAEVIFFCLFNLYDPTGCQTRLSPHYPCISGLVSKEFRNAVYKWLVELKRSPLFATSLIRRSMLDDCAGERYEDLLYHFSSYLFRKQVSALPKRKVDIFMKCALDSASSLEDLLVHDVIQSHHLTTLQSRKANALALYESFAIKLRTLQVLECSERDSTGPAQERSSILEQPLARIRQVVTSSRVLDLLTPSSPQIDPFLARLPWDPTMTDKGTQPNHRHQLEQDMLASNRQIERKVVLLDGLPEYQSRVYKERPLNLKPSKSARDLHADVHTQFGANFLKDLARDLDEFEHEFSRTQTGQRFTSSVQMPDISTLRVDQPLFLQALNKKELSVYGQGHVLPRSDFVRRVKNCEDEPSIAYELPPETPMRAPVEQPTATAKSVRRLMDLLNNSEDPSMSVSPTHKHASRQVGTGSLPARRLEATFRLWDQ